MALVGQTQRDEFGRLTSSISSRSVYGVVTNSAARRRFLRRPADDRAQFDVGVSGQDAGVLAPPPLTGPDHRHPEALVRSAHAEALDHVAACAAVGRVVARPADQHVVAGTAGQDVVAVAADEHVVAVAAVDREQGRVGGQRRGIDDVVALERGDGQAVAAGDGAGQSGPRRDPGDRGVRTLPGDVDDVVTVGRVDDDVGRGVVAATRR